MTSRLSLARERRRQHRRRELRAGERVAQSISDPLSNVINSSSSESIDPPLERSSSLEAQERESQLKIEIDQNGEDLVTEEQMTGPSGECEEEEEVYNLLDSTLNHDFTANNFTINRHTITKTVHKHTRVKI